MTPIARLLSPRVSLLRYCLEAWPIALIPSALLVGVAGAVVLWSGRDLSPTSPTLSEVANLGEVITAYVGYGLIAPVVETALLALTIKFINRLLQNPVAIAGLAALIWGGLHAAISPLWFFGTVWSFFVFACAFIAWRPHSFRSAYIAALVPHVLVNLTATTGATAALVLDAA